LKKITDYTTHYTDHTGEKWGRWTVEYTYHKRNGEHVYLFAHTKCECGTEKEVFYKNLVIGESKSCGCLNQEVLHEVEHGHTANGKWSPTYRSWAAMRQRCLNHKNTKYLDYGGRGIKICPRWDKFQNFLEDMGEMPFDKSLDRIDVNGDYIPENCRWATWKEQCRNKRQTVYVEWEGKKQTFADLAERYGFRNGKILYNRVINRGWALEKALSIPSLANGRNHYVR